MSTFPKLLFTILRERNTHTRARDEEYAMTYSFCTQTRTTSSAFSASKALTSSLSSSSFDEETCDDDAGKNNNHITVAASDA